MWRSLSLSLIYFFSSLGKESTCFVFGGEKARVGKEKELDDVRKTIGEFQKRVENWQEFRASWAKWSITHFYRYLMLIDKERWSHPTLFPDCETMQLKWDEFVQYSDGNLPSTFTGNFSLSLIPLYPSFNGSQATF